MKPCSQVLAGGPCFHGYSLPLYALYGSVNNKLYICTNLFPRKDHYYNIRIWNGFRWIDSTTQEHADIRRFISSYMHSDSFIRKKCVAQNSGKKRERAFREEKHMLSDVCPKDRKLPTEYSVAPGSQSRIDGRNYSLSYEEYYRVEPMRTCGLPVQYSGSKPSATQNGTLMTTNSFDSLREEAPHKDHMKVKQTKIRPEKSKTRKVVIRVNGEIKASYVESKTM